MKPCILLYPVTICYIVCGIHAVRQSNGRGFIFRGLGGREGQYHLREKDSASGYIVGDTNFENNGDISPVIIPLNDVGNSFDGGTKSNPNEYHELAPLVNAMDPIDEPGNIGLVGDENNANKYLNTVMHNDAGDLQSSEMHSSEEEDHELSSNNFNIGGETNDDRDVNILIPNTVDANLNDERQNNTKGSLNFEMKGNADVTLNGHNQDADLNIGGESSASDFKIAAQTDVTENRGLYFYPTYNDGGNFNIGAKGINTNFNLPMQEAFHNFNVAAKSDKESRGFKEKNSIGCGCSRKPNISPIDAQGNAIHELYSVGPVNGGGVLNSETLIDGGYNIEAKGITNSFFNVPVQNNKIHGFYHEWQGNEGRNPNIGIQGAGVFNKEVKGVTNGYLNYPMQGIYGPYQGTQGGNGGYINYQLDNRIHGTNNGMQVGDYINYGFPAVNEHKSSGGGGGFNVASSYINYPIPYNTIYLPYNAGSRYFTGNGDKNRDINIKTQGAEERGYNVAGHYYTLPKQNSMIQGLNTAGQISINKGNGKGNGIPTNDYKVAVHGHNLADNSNSEFYTGEPASIGLNIGIHNDGGYSSKTKGNSMISSYYKLPTHIYTQHALDAGEQGNKGSLNTVQGKKGVYNIEGKELLVQDHLANFKLPGATTDSNLNHVSQNFIINGEQINKKTGLYFKIEDNGKGGFYFVPYKVPVCGCQQPAGLPIDNETNLQINIGGGKETDDSSNFEGNTVVKANLIDNTNNDVQKDVNSQFQGNIQTNKGVVGTEEINNFEANLSEQGKLISNVNDETIQSIMKKPLADNTQGNIGGNINIEWLNKLKQNIIGQDNMNSQVSSGGFSHVNGNIPQSNFMNGIIDPFSGGFGDFGRHPKWVNNFGREVIPPWFANIDSGYTNFIGGLNTEGGIYSGIENDYVNGKDSYKGRLNNGAYINGGFLAPENNVGALNSQEIGHFKGQLNLIERKSDKPSNTIIVRKGDKVGGVKGKSWPYLKNENGKPQINVNGRLYANNFKDYGSRLDGDGFRNGEKEFDNKMKMLNDGKTGVDAPWSQNNTRKEILKAKLRKYLVKILAPKQAAELGLTRIYQNVNWDKLSDSNGIEYSNTPDNNSKDQLNASDRLRFSKGEYRFPKLGPFERQISFRPRYSGPVGRLRGYNKVSRG